MQSVCLYLEVVLDNVRWCQNADQATRKMDHNKNDFLSVRYFRWFPMAALLVLWRCYLLNISMHTVLLSSPQDSSESFGLFVVWFLLSSFSCLSWFRMIKETLDACNAYSVPLFNLVLLALYDVSETSSAWPAKTFLMSCPLFPDVVCSLYLMMSVSLFCPVLFPSLYWSPCSICFFLPFWLS